MGQDTKLEHRLAAIMATDVVGYSKLMESDEAGALATLAGIREATQNQIRANRGRIANTAGLPFALSAGNNVTLYWLTNTAISSARLYLETRHNLPAGDFFDVRGIKIP